MNNTLSALIYSLNNRRRDFKNKLDKLEISRKKSNDIIKEIDRLNKEIKKIDNKLNIIEDKIIDSLND
jgi:polyhydroxyalkanoate synthesis regulator phasin